MKKEMEYMTIEYNTCDLPDIEEISCILKKEIKDVLNFFEITKLEPKVTVRLWPDLEKFRKVFALKNQNIVGLRQKVKEKPIIEIVSFKEIKKIKYYENMTREDFARLILHEFVHECHVKFTTKKCYIWLWEGAATFLSKQYRKINPCCSTLDEMKERKNTNYQEFYTMFSYVYQTYGKSYIVKLLTDFTLQEKDTPRLYLETKDYIKNKG